MRSICHIPQAGQIAALAFVLLSGCSSIPNNVDALDDKTLVSTIVRDFEVLPIDVKGTDVLAWNAQKSSNGQTVEAILLWAHIKIEDAPRLRSRRPEYWVMYVLERNSTRGNRWEESAKRSKSHWESALRFYSSAPTNADVTDFLFTAVRFTMPDGEAIYGVARNQAWKKSIGESPIALKGSQAREQ